MKSNIETLQENFDSCADALAACSKKHSLHGMPREYYEKLLPEFWSARKELNSALDALAEQKNNTSKTTKNTNERYITSLTYNRIQKRNHRMICKMLEGRRLA